MAARQEAARIPNKKERYPRVPRQKQQSRRQHGANGFAFVPHTRRFLGQQSLGVETGGEERRLLHLPPSSVPRKRGGPGRLGKISVRATARLREKMAPTLKGRGRVFHPAGDSGDVQQLRRSMQEKVRPQY